MTTPEPEIRIPRPKPGTITVVTSYGDAWGAVSGYSRSDLHTTTWGRKVLADLADAAEQMRRSADPSWSPT